MEVTAYALNHYRHGVSATFSKPTERYHYCIKIHVKSWFPVKNTSAREMKIGHILLLSVFLLVPVFSVTRRSRSDVSQSVSQ